MAGVVTVIEPVVCPQAGWVTASTGAGVDTGAGVTELLATLTPLKMLEAWKVVPSMLYS